MLPLYITSHAYRIDKELVIKVADLGLAKYIYADNYYRMGRKSKIPIKWMPPESIHDRYYDQKTDVVGNVKYINKGDSRTFADWFLCGDLILRPLPMYYTLVYMLLPFVVMDIGGIESVLVPAKTISCLIDNQVVLVLIHY